ncbi:MAG: hypothetical protein AAF624_14715 [Bacteroidota bacterium]
MRRQRLTALFVLGALLLNYPLLTLADRAEAVLGVPVLYVYLFMVWASLVALAAWTVERRREPESAHRVAPPDAEPAGPARALR